MGNVEPIFLGWMCVWMCLIWLHASGRGNYVIRMFRDLNVYFNSDMDSGRDCTGDEVRHTQRDWENISISHLTYP